MSAPADHNEGQEDLHQITIVHSFPENYFVENIAVRRNGQLLVTVHNRGELIQVDPQSKSEPTVIHTFSTGVAGIVEVEDDVFYLSVGSLGEKGTHSIYRADMSTSPAKVTEHAPVPDALFLNGSALLNLSKGIFLAADSFLGCVFAIDVHNRTIKTWIQDKVLAKTTDNPYFPGVNGIKIHGGYLYLSNTDARTFLRIRLTDTGEATGSIEQVCEGINADDFAFDAQGSAYLTSHVFNSVVKITSNGSRSRIAGGPDDKLVAGSTAVAFGRTKRDKNSIYITTNGGMSNPVNGQIGPAQVLSVDVGEPATPDYRPAYLVNE